MKFNWTPETCALVHEKKAEGHSPADIQKEFLPEATKSQVLYHLNKCKMADSPLGNSKTSILYDLIRNWLLFFTPFDSFKDKRKSESLSEFYAMVKKPRVSPSSSRGQVVKMEGIESSGQIQGYENAPTVWFQKLGSKYYFIARTAHGLVCKPEIKSDKVTFTYIHERPNEDAIKELFPGMDISVFDWIRAKTFTHTVYLNPHCIPRRLKDIAVMKKEFVGEAESAYLLGFTLDVANDLAQEDEFTF